MMDSNRDEVVVSRTTKSLMMRVLVLVSFVGFLIIVNEVTVIPSSTSEERMPLSSSRTTETTRTSISASSSLGNSNGRHSSKPTATPRVDKRSYMSSERRVPNGPDPIHNRRARKSKEPPGRA
ncbi:hypothetical protein C5167_036111 [Papaver somniferum]|uniref:CLAVATA3/ESR (CLE)-related protein TDIF-like n=1 Tax=Papaver somniferum TaxID=3469 RepID=UPI000E7049AF|nr:CLAVATA3/ESR (CLE)-related protein TDIF-like [Papaver somniferum]RZC87572.1 hypothetical protein C5167_036111 [Papaver somniferum]